VRRVKDRYRDRTGAEKREVTEAHRGEKREEPKDHVSLQHALEEAMMREQPWSQSISRAR